MVAPACCPGRELAKQRDRRHVADHGGRHRTERVLGDGQQFDVRAIAELGKRAAIEVTAQARVD